jgi:hypothetical protein
MPIAAWREKARISQMPYLRAFARHEGRGADAAAAS